MTESKTYTEREVILRERRAVGRAINAVWPHIKRGLNGLDWVGSDAIRDCLYPLPKVTRPRVLPDEFGMGWKYENGAFYYTLSVRPDLVRWHRATANVTPTEITASRVALWATLLDNPTEEVDDDTLDA